MKGMSQSMNKSFNAHDSSDEFKRAILTVIDDDLMYFIKYTTPKIKIQMTETRGKKIDSLDVCNERWI